MNLHNRKMMAPIIIVLLLGAYYLTLIMVILRLNLPLIFKIGIIAFSIIVTLILIWVLIERIKEIREGEEDDLGKY